MIRSMSKPVLAMGLLAVMAVAWYWALLPRASSGSAASVSVRPTIATTSERVPSVRLDALAGRPVPPLGLPAGRNPFRATPGPAAGVSMDASGAGAVPRRTAAPDPVAAVGQALWPRLELIGLAEALEGGSLIRTAILSGPRGVLHARPGEVLEGVYRVERIAGDIVDVRLLPEDRVVRLSLRR